MFSNEHILTQTAAAALAALHLLMCSGCTGFAAAMNAHAVQLVQAWHRRLPHHFLRLRPASAASLAAAITAFFLVALMPRFFVPCATTKLSVTLSSWVCP